MPRGLLLLFLGALLVRVIVMAWSFQFRENTDILRWRDWGRITFLYDFAATYKPEYTSFGTIPNNMPPGTLYIVSSAFYINIQATKIILKVFEHTESLYAFINGPWINGFLRIPSLVADLLLGLFIYRFVRHTSSHRNAMIASSLFLFNPAVIFNSSFWGQMDPINNLFFYLSFYYLYRKQYFLSVLSFFLSLYVKLSLLYFLPVITLLIFLQTNRNIKKMVFSFALSILVILVLTLPISSRPDLWLFHFLSINSLGEMQHITNFAFNFWWFVFKPSILIGDQYNLFSFSEIQLTGSPLDSTRFFSIPLGLFGIFLFSLFSVPLLIKLHKTTSKFLLQNTFLICSLIALLAFLFLPRMHERYMYPLFPLLATYIGISQKNIWIYVFLSFLHMINLYIVWHPIPFPMFPYELISSIQFQWLLSIGSVLIGTYWYAKSLSILYYNDKKR